MKKKADNTKEKTDIEKFQDSFIQEVDEDLKKDNLKKIWDKYGLYIIIAVVLILTSAVSFETFKVMHEKRNQTWSDKYALALNMQLQGRYDDSLKMLNDLVNHKHDVYSDLAKVQIANIYFEQGNTDKAIEELNNIINDANMNQKLKDVSVIKLASYKLDTAPKEELVKMLSPLVQTDNSWTNVAKEMLAMVEIREGNIEGAKKIYEEILASPNLPEILKFRVQDMLAVLNDN